MKRILLVCMFFSLAACDGWLDVSPKSQVKGDDLFKDEAGFQTAMFGVYTSMVSSGLYGSNLSMGMLDVLGRYYDVPSTHSYFDVYAYNYESSRFENFSDNIWLGMYRTIMNCNNLLENMEGKESLFASGHYPVMKGEMLGVRACMHFDLLRVFAPSFAEGKTLPAIPYVDKVSRNPFPQLTVEQVTKRIIEDCGTALELLKVDPWVLEGKDEFSDRFFEARRERMNYYAVKALLARVYLYAGNTEEAGRIAGELLEVYGLGTTAPLFSLYSDKIADYADGFFAVKEDNSGIFTETTSLRDEIFETSRYSSDRRLSEWTEVKTGSTSVFLITKYRKAVLVPLIRMNEMYYIYAECRASESEGLKALNRVRNSYGIPSQMDLEEGKCVFADELQKEYRKSFLGEGQFFYFLKRRDVKQIPSAPQVENPRKVFTLPMPQSELEFGDLINQ